MATYGLHKSQQFLTDLQTAPPCSRAERLNTVQGAIESRDAYITDLESTLGQPGVVRGLREKHGMV
ncbi:MAG: hypothetical protein HQ582_04120 [Planctomycetes bacterium]|nr:hypothetical protein [Planctomycetota bacterium]